LQGDLKLKLAGLSLKPFAPYINTIVRLNLNRGTANTSGKLKLASRAGKPLALAFDGGFSVDKLDITEEESAHPSSAGSVWRATTYTSGWHLTGCMSACCVRPIRSPRSSSTKMAPAISRS